jgi:hypothetical protein
MAPDTACKTFGSNIVQGDVSYLIYPPREYERQTGTCYTVLYDLPASVNRRRAAPKLSAV